MDDSARVYALAPGQRWFDVGQCADGRQALMAAFETGTLGVFFDAQGRLLECAAVGPERLRADPKTGHADASHLRAWQAELGFTPCEIRVRKFHDARQHIGIEPLPAHYEDFLEDPESEPDPAIRRRTEAQIRAWIANGCFVLYWGSDLWLDADGVVTSWSGARRPHVAASRRVEPLRDRDDWREQRARDRAPSIIDGDRTRERGSEAVIRLHDRAPRRVRHQVPIAEAP